MFLQQTGIKDLFLIDKPTFIDTYTKHFISPFSFYLIQNKPSFKRDLRHAFSTFGSVNFSSLMFEVLLKSFPPLSLVLITKNVVSSIWGTGRGGAGGVLIPFSAQCLGYRCEGLLSSASSTWSCFSRIRNKEMHKKSFENNKDKLRNTRIFFSPTQQREVELWAKIDHGCSLRFLEIRDLPEKASPPVEAEHRPERPALPTFLQFLAPRALRSISPGPVSRARAGSTHARKWAVPAGVGPAPTTERRCLRRPRAAAGSRRWAGVLGLVSRVLSSAACFRSWKMPAVFRSGALAPSPLVRWRRPGGAAPSEESGSAC